METPGNKKTVGREEFVANEMVTTLEAELRQARATIAHLKFELLAARQELETVQEADEDGE